MNKMFRRTTAALAIAALLTPALAYAQSANPAGLNVRDFQVLTKPDPQIRKATAIVNGAVITDLDIDQRLALAVVASGGKIGQQEREQLRIQVMRNLIDEKLQIAEAREQEITVEEGQVEGAFARVAKNFGRSSEAFARYLKDIGTSAQSLRDQIRAEVAWSQLMRRRVEPFVNVGDDEVKAAMDRMEASKGQQEYRLGEIFIAASPEQLERARTTANRIVEQIRNGASFVAYARQYSEASTAAVGGDMGWVMSSQLSPALRSVADGLPKGQISEPLEVAGGITVLAKVDQREVMGADPKEAVITAKQIAVPVDETLPEADRRAAVERIHKATRDFGGCGRAEALAAELGGDVTSIDPQPLGQFAEGLQPLLAQLQIGQATPVFGTQKDARVLVLCGRDETENKGPSFEQIYAQMNEERVSLMARRYLRDLRRDAIVDYR